MGGGVMEWWVIRRVEWVRTVCFLCIVFWWHVAAADTIDVWLLQEFRDLQNRMHDYRVHHNRSVFDVHDMKERLAHWLIVAKESKNPLYPERQALVETQIDLLSSHVLIDNLQKRVQSLDEQVMFFEQQNRDDIATFLQQQKEAVASEKKRTDDCLKQLHEKSRVTVP